MKISRPHLEIIGLAILTLICFVSSAYYLHSVFADVKVEIKYVNVTVNGENVDYCKVYNNTLVVVFKNGKAASINLPEKIGYNENSYTLYSFSAVFFTMFGVIFLIITIAKYYDLKGDC